MPDRSSAATTTLIYAACAALWILLSGTVLFITVDDPRLQAQIEIAKGLAFVAISSGILFMLLRMRRDAAPAALLHGPDELPRRALRPLLLVPSVLVLIAPMVGISVYLLYAQQLERDALDDLGGVATLKAQQIENWLAERRGDAMVLAVGRGFGERLAAIRDGSDLRQFDLVHDRISTTRDAYAYESITLLDADGSVLVNVGEHAVPSEADKALVRRAKAAGAVRMGDLWHDEGRRAYLGFAAPLLDDAKIEPVGAVLLRVRAQEFLYPLLDAWPTPSASGRTWLVRRDGERARWLGDARGRDGMASQRLLDDARHPALAAVRTQATGAGTGEDDDGVAVLAAWRRVAGTDWQLVTVLARAEALAPARTTALWAAAVALFGAAMVALAVLLMLRQQRVARHVALQVQADRLLKHFYELPFVGMAITSPRTGHWVQFNDHLCDMLGYSRKELVQLTWMELTHAEDLDEDVRAFQRVLAGEIEGYAMEKRFIRKDRSVLSASMDVKSVRGPDGAVAYLVCVVRDISQRKATQARILKLSRLYLTLSRCNAAIVHCSSEQSLFAEVCLAAVQSGGAAMAWVGMLDTDSGAVRPRASFGTGVEYLRDADISVRADDAHGLGPTGTAIRDGEPIWCHDFRNDPLTAPWHAAGARYGWHASAALPLRRGGVTVGALSLYMVEQSAFDDETRNLLEEIAAAVSFGLESLGREAARQRAAQALRDSEQRYRMLFDNSQDAILLTAPDGSILNANPAACRIFGGSEEQLRAAGRSGLVDTADPRVQRALEQRARSGSFSGELTMRRLDGEPFPAEISSALFTERDGQTRTSMIVRDITERKRTEAQLIYLAQHDALTDLPNRLLLTDRLNMALAAARRAGTRLALMFMDLDRFKMVNDSFGHGLGDRLLREAAARLRESVRASDTISRQGGDEFLVILPEIEHDEAAALVAEKLIAAFAEPFVIDHTEIVITVSIGIVCFPQNGHDADTLLRNADAAMYVAKDRGRNRYQFYSSEMNARAHERLQLEADLRRAIEREQLHLVYQPQIALATGAVIGLEALLRWSHPTRGEVPPGRFIAIAEDSGLIESIGSWALEAACAQHARWVADGLIAGPVAVNVSSHQFRQPDFVDVVAAALSRCALDAHLLELELTEGIVMRGVDQVLHKLQALHALGVRIAIDDFGTGYSSLSYLKQFPIYRLKIDQSFTRGLPDDRSSAAIAQAVISMGHSLGLNVVAEGVETPAQEAYLRSSSCDAGQGYLYARPMPAAECTQYLRARIADARPDETPAAG